MSAQDAVRDAMARNLPVYWWHSAILADLDRIAAIDDNPFGHGYTVAGVVDNARLGSDGTRYVDQLESWGYVRTWMGESMGHALRMIEATS